VDRLTADHEGGSMQTIQDQTHVRFPDLEVDDFARRLAEAGFVLMTDVPERFDHVEFLQNFGPLMPQYDGELIWSIRADPKFDDVYHSLNTKELFPHTECYEFDATPPKYLSLWCLVPNADEGGHTTLMDTRPFLASLTEVELDVLREPAYNFNASAGVQKMNLARTATQPMLAEREGREPILRYSYNNSRYEGSSPEIARDVIEHFLAYFGDNCVGVKMNRGDLLIWNNHWVVHSRTAYTDRSRHLRRVWLAESD
jgi:alpha-ketoglutarate-dependent taurine dioxygenase